MDLAELKDTLDTLEPRIERLKALYQQYFLGFEKIPPSVLRKEVDRTMWQLRRLRFNNTRLRFKFQQLVQRYNTYQQYWSRILREIERGTYQRNLNKAAKLYNRATMQKIAGTHGALAADRQQQLSERDDDDAPTPQRPFNASGFGDVLGQAFSPPSSVSGAARSNDDSETSPAAGSESPAPPGLRPPPPPPQADDANAPATRRPAPPPPAEGERQTRALYDKYLDAKRAEGGATEALSYEQLKRSLKKNTAQLRKKHGPSKTIDYEVVERGGRTVIQPVLRTKK